MQLEMFNKGAVFLKFAEPDFAPDGTPIPKDEAYKKGVQQWRQMEEKGFMLTTDGCMFPHEQYGVRGAGATLKGHQRSTFFFTGMMPWRQTVGNTGKPVKGKVIRDKDGWPTGSQISHLCHRGGCCRPDHLQIELQVENLRRNYCGILNTGTCDCGMQPPCLHKYHPSDWEDPNMAFCSAPDSVSTALAGLPAAFTYTVLDRETVRSDALAHEQSARRKRNKAKAAAKADGGPCKKAKRTLDLESD
jgi:hypothetical protein